MCNVIYKNGLSFLAKEQPSSMTYAKRVTYKWAHHPVDDGLANKQVNKKNLALESLFLF